MTPSARIVTREAEFFVDTTSHWWNEIQYWKKRFHVNDEQKSVLLQMFLKQLSCVDVIYYHLSRPKERLALFMWYHEGR